MILKSSSRPNAAQVFGERELGAQVSQIWVDIYDFYWGGCGIFYWVHWYGQYFLIFLFRSPNVTLDVVAINAVDIALSSRCPDDRAGATTRKFNANHVSH